MRISLPDTVSGSSLSLRLLMMRKHALIPALISSSSSRDVMMWSRSSRYPCSVSVCPVSCAWGVPSWASWALRLAWASSCICSADLRVASGSSAWALLELHPVSRSVATARVAVIFGVMIFMLSSLVRFEFSYCFREWWRARHFVIEVLGSVRAQVDDSCLGVSVGLRVVFVFLDVRISTAIYPLHLS